MIVGLGIDLVDVARFGRVLARRGRRLRDRLFTPAEQAACERTARALERYAARFAVKEACFKALGTGFTQGVLWTEVEVLADDRGAPTVALSGLAARLAAARGVRRIHVSLTHDHPGAAAVVVLEGGAGSAGDG